MSNKQRGRLVLKEVHGKEAENKIAFFLSKYLKNASNERIKKKVKNTPFVLSKNMPAEKAQLIIKAFKKIGATATFVPHAPGGKLSSEQTATLKPPKRNALTPPPLPTSKPLYIKPKGAKGSNRTRLAVLTAIFLILSLGYSAWRFYPVVTKNFSVIGSSTQKSPLSSIDLGTYTMPNRAPLIMQVEPREMYKTFLQQYQLHPDTRFIKAFKTLTQSFEGYQDRTLNQSSFKIGEVISNGKEVRIPLLKDNQKITEFTIQLPMTFSVTMSALRQCLNIMSEGQTKPDITSFNKHDLITHDTAQTNIDEVDPRSILEGLMRLEGLWQKKGPHPQLLLTAVRAYSLLIMVLFPDRMDYTDDFAAHALVYLTMSNQMEPDRIHINEEALLAMVMGYTAHAKVLMESDSSGAMDFSSKILEAYVKKDLQALKKLKNRTDEIIGAYLLARLYRESGLRGQAGEVTKNTLEIYPNHYPMIAEAIYSADAVTARRLTVLYPLDILFNLEGQKTSETFSDAENRQEMIQKVIQVWTQGITIQDRFKGIIGNQSTADISISQYENLLDKWVAVKFKTNRGFLLDESRIKTVFRTLFTGALFLRFDMLLHRLHIVDKAENFAQMLANKDKDHPLVIEMLADVGAESGGRIAADKICTYLINHPKVSGRIVYSTYFDVEDQIRKTQLNSDAANKIDGRPEYMFFKGYLLQHQNNYDLAEKYYRLLLKQNPYYYNGYKYLSHITRSGDPLDSAIKKYPFSFSLLEKAGDHFKEQFDRKSKQKAVECYTRAMKLVPISRTLPRKKAKVLKQLDRYKEAVDILQTWLQENDTKDLNMVFYRTSLADTYLKMKRPQLAMEVIRQDIDSYQADAMMVVARTYESNGQLDQAEQRYLRAIKRWPTLDYTLSGTAAFFWRRGRYEKAAKIIAMGRKTMGRFSRWYFEDFAKTFASAPEENILKAVDLLTMNGASGYEVSSLGFQLQKNQRPEIGFKIIQKIKAQGIMYRLEKIVALYKVLKEWKGEEEAMAYIRKAVPPKQRDLLAIVLYKNGLFDLILTEIGDSAEVEPVHQEFFWLQRLIAWLALEKQPADLNKTFFDHYNPSWLNKIKLKVQTKNPHDYYYDIGRYLLGLMSYKEIIGLVKTPKQRCEFSYYIGLGERLKSNFPEAANWYHLCLETQLRNNGEYHWASEELFWWAHMGTRKRHLLLGDDIKAYHTKRRRHT